MKVSPNLVSKELAKRGLRKELALDPRFVAQNAFIQDSSRYIAVQCSRRAGKTNGLAIRYLHTLEKHPGCQCLYMSLTRESALNIMWPVLQELNERYNLGCIFTQSKLEMTYPNGSKLRLLGADMKNFVKRLKGIKTPGIGIDEAQDFGTHLQSLIDDVLTPAMADYPDSWLALTGTPGPVPMGYFFEVTHQKKYGYTTHNWTIFDNPYMPNPEIFLADLKNKRQWADNNPTLLREWMNQWTLDTESLWVRYNENKNHFENLPNGKHVYILGIDIGFNDADALAVVAWNEAGPTTYLVEELITEKQDFTSLVNQINMMSKKYDISKMVIDEGGLGKKLAEEMRRRHHIPVQPAEKTRKQETVAFLNDALRTRTFMAKKDSRFAQDSYMIEIDWEKTTPDKIVIKKNPHSDIIDAVIYAFKESPAFSYQAPKAKPKLKTEEWYKAEVSAMEEAAEEYFKALDEADKDPYDDYM